MVANRLHSRFQAWLSDWVKSNVTNDQESGCRDWLLGQVEGLHPCTTTCELVTNTAIQHNKYSVKWEKNWNSVQEQEEVDDENKEGEEQNAATS